MELFVALQGLDGFKDSDFDVLWKYLEQNCGVYLKKIKEQAQLEESDFDLAMKSIEDAADRVDETQSGSVQKKAKEADLMKKVERCLETTLEAFSMFVFFGGVIVVIVLLQLNFYCIAITFNILARPSELAEESGTAWIKP